jgi:hypothetical protein
MAAMLVYLTREANEKSFVNGTPTWRRWRHVQTKNCLIIISKSETQVSTGIVLNGGKWPRDGYCKSQKVPFTVAWPFWKVTEFLHESEVIGHIGLLDTLITIHQVVSITSESHTLAFMQRLGYFPRWPSQPWKGWKTLTGVCSVKECPFKVVI